MFIVKSYIWRRCLLFAVPLLLVVLFAPIHQVSNRISAGTRQRRRLGLVWIALHEYAADHAGMFPARLADCDQSFLPPEAQQFHDLLTGKPIDWIYYPGHTSTDSPTTILAAFPSPILEHWSLVISMNYRMISSIGSPTEYITEREFQRRLTAQGRR